MRVSEDFIQQKIKDGTLHQIADGAYKSRVKRLIREESLSDDILRALWPFRGFRWEIARTQKLPEDLITHLINDQDSNLATYEEVFINNVLKDDHIKRIDQVLTGTDVYYLMWKNEPERCYTLCNFESYVESISELFQSFEARIIKRAQKSFVEVVRKNPTCASRALKIIFETEKTRDIWPFLEIIVKTSFLDDDSIDLIQTNVDKYIYIRIMELAISRDGCSTNKRAKFLLEI
jgi:hypothetical protein